MKISLKNNLVILGSIAIISLFIFSPKITHAETHVKTSSLWISGATWTKEGSPYILDEGIYLPPRGTLRIGEGVSIMLASSTDWSKIDNAMFLEGKVFVDGTTDHPVIFDNVKKISMRSNSSKINNAVFTNTNLYMGSATSTISNSIIKNADTAIETYGSVVAIDHTRLLNNRIGIYAGNSGTPKNIININNSSISHNKEYGIIQESTTTLKASNNWWGSKDGPRVTDIGKGDKIGGLVDATPWLVENPYPQYEVSCCSSVLFIPGLEASRLYKDSSGLFGTSTNQLWEPNRNDDVRKMYLDNTGKSLDPHIYTSDVISSAFGLKSIYESFIAMMNGVVADGSIKEWLPFPYDWRMNVEEVVKNGVLIQNVEKLAKNSKTGKVIVVAHSNGGLVAKELMKTLTEKGEGDLIEQVINVAVPELGTPQSILGLLHGHNQSILGGLILTANNARTFGQNMSGAYGLLPSKKFFEKNPLTVISNLFSSSSLPTFASTYNAMKDFLLSNSFSKASTTDTNIPLLMNPLLASVADSIHSIIDIFKPAVSTKTLSIFGWGLPTSKGIEYEKDKHCSQAQIRYNTCPVAFSPTLTDSGDGTVITKANSENADQTLFIDLKKIQTDTEKNIDHANILESKDLLDKVKDTITNSTSTTPTYEKYFSTVEPINTDRYLTIKIYSPVDIHIYDAKGNHTGILKNPIPGKDLEAYEKNIPLSYYGDFGRIKMIRVPYDKDYQIILEGNGTGPVTAIAEVTQDDITIASTTFADIPVTTLTNIDLVIATSTESFATSTVMNIDADGDGITEYVQNSEEFLLTNPDYIKHPKKFIKVINKIQRKILKK